MWNIQIAILAWQPQSGGLGEILNLSRMLSQSVGVGKLREAGFWLERGSAEVWSVSSVLEGSSRHALPRTPRWRRDPGLLDAPDASGDDVHDALPSGCSAPDHQDRRSHLEAVRLEDGVGGGTLSSYDEAADLDRRIG